MGKAQFFLAAVAVFVLACLMLTTVSGRWARDQHASRLTNWTEFGIWNRCTKCTDNLNTACNYEDNYWRAVQGFSLIAVILEFILAILFTAKLLLGEAPLFQQHVRRFYYAVTITCFVALVSCFLSWTLYTTVFTRRELCDGVDSSWSDRGYHLTWAFAFRILENIGLLIVQIICCTLLYKGKALKNGTTYDHVARFFLIGILMLGIITCASRGWMNKAVPGNDMYSETGLFDNCECYNVEDLKCRSDRSRLQTVEGFAVMQLVFQLALIVFLTAGNDYKLYQYIFGFASWVAQLITWTVFVSYFTEAVCADPGPNNNLVSIESTHKLHWAFGLEVTMFIVHTLFLVALCVEKVRQARKLFTEPSEETKEKEEP